MAEVTQYIPVGIDDSEGRSLADHARAIKDFFAEGRAVQEAERRDCREHRCRVSRCGCVACNNGFLAPAHDARHVSQKERTAKHTKGGGATTSKLAPTSSTTHQAPSSSAYQKAEERARRREESRIAWNLGPSKGDKARRSLASRRKFVPTLEPLLDLGNSSVSIQELPLESSSGMPLSVNRSNSLSNTMELTETALRKSQYLLNQLSDLELDSESEVDKHPIDDMNPQSARSQISSSTAPESQRKSNLETVEVPVVLLSMLSEAIEEMRSSRSEGGHAMLPSLTSGAMDELCKNHLGHMSSRSSLLSAASTGSPQLASEVGSDTSESSDPPDTVISEPPVAFTPPCSARLLSTGTVVPLGLASIRAASPRLVPSTPSVNFRQPGTFQCQSVSSALGPRGIIVTTGVPTSGSHARVTVTTSQTIRHTQTIHLSTQ